MTTIEATVKRIRSFAELEADWDGEGAHQTAPAAMDEAVSIITDPQADLIQSLGVKVDAVPTAGGGVLVEWRAPQKRLQVYVSHDADMHGLAVDMEGGQVHHPNQTSNPDPH